MQNRYSHKVASLFARKRFESVVDSRIETNDFAVRFELTNERYKVGALETVFVKIVRCSVACGNHHNSRSEEGGEEAF
jgi:hypothetical protein